MGNTISLRAARVNAGMTQKKVGEIQGLDFKTIGAWENGLTAIPAIKFFELCKLYNVNSDIVEVPRVKDGKYNE